MATDTVKKFILNQSYDQKINLLENAFDEGFGTFWGIANILLEAPCGKGGGLPTEVINEVFQRKLKEK